MSWVMRCLAVPLALGALACGPATAQLGVGGGAPGGGGSGSAGGSGSGSADDTGVDAGPVDFSACSAASGAAFDLLEVRVVRDELVVDVAYSGGCADHTFTVCWPDPTWTRDVPAPRTSLEIRHDTPGDPCEAYPSETVTFDLQPIAESLDEAGYDPADGALLDVGRFQVFWQPTD